MVDLTKFLLMREIFWFFHTAACHIVKNRSSTILVICMSMPVSPYTRKSSSLSLISYHLDSRFTNDHSISTMMPIKIRSNTTTYPNGFILRWLICFPRLKMGCLKAKYLRQLGICSCPFDSLANILDHFLRSHSCNDTLGSKFQ